MSLSDTAIKNAKANPDKALKLADEKGMYLFISSNGSKYFRFDYRFDGKRKTLSLGVDHETSLKQTGINEIMRGNLYQRYRILSWQP